MLKIRVVFVYRRRGGISFGNSYPTVAGSYSTTWSGGTIDMAISKFTPDGTGLIYSTYIGGSDNEVSHSLVVDSQDNLVILGSTGSSNYPTTGGCYDNTFNGGDLSTQEIKLKTLMPDDFQRGGFDNLPRMTLELGYSEARLTFFPATPTQESVLVVTFRPFRLSTCQEHCS